MFTFYDSKGNSLKRIEIYVIPNCAKNLKILTLVESEGTIETLRRNISDTLPTRKEFKNLKGLKVLNPTKISPNGEVITLQDEESIQNKIKYGDIIYCDIITNEIWLKVIYNFKNNFINKLIQVYYKFDVKLTIKKLKILLLKYGIDLFVEEMEHDEVKKQKLKTGDFEEDLKGKKLVNQKPEINNKNKTNKKSQSQNEEINQFISENFFDYLYYIDKLCYRFKKDILYKLNDTEIDDETIKNYFDFNSEIIINIQIGIFEELIFSEIKTFNMRMPNNYMRFNDYKEQEFEDFITNLKFKPEKELMKRMSKELIYRQMKNKHHNLILYFYNEHEIMEEQYEQINEKDEEEHNLRCSQISKQENSIKLVHSNKTESDNYFLDDEQINKVDEEEDIKESEIDNKNEDENNIKIEKEKENEKENEINNDAEIDTNEAPIEKKIKGTFYKYNKPFSSRSLSREKGDYSNVSVKEPNKMVIIIPFGKKEFDNKYKSPNDQYRSLAFELSNLYNIEEKENENLNNSLNIKNQNNYEDININNISKISDNKQDININNMNKNVRINISHSKSRPRHTSLYFETNKIKSQNLIKYRDNLKDENGSKIKIQNDQLEQLLYENDQNINKRRGIRSQLSSANIYRYKGKNNLNYNLNSEIINLFDNRKFYSDIRFKRKFGINENEINDESLPPSVIREKEYLDEILYQDKEIDIFKGPKFRISVSHWKIVTFIFLLLLYLVAKILLIYYDYM